MSDYRLVYYSTNRISGRPDDIARQIEQILDKSRRNNVLVGVTGALMFSAGYFAQVLEGPQAAVEATFERIQQDARHGDVALLEFFPVARRGFDSWSMAYVGGGKDAGDFAHIAAQTGFDPEKLSGQQLFDKLQELLNRQAPQAA